MLCESVVQMSLDVSDKGNTEYAPSTESAGFAQITAPMGQPAVRWLHQGCLRPLIQRFQVTVSMTTVLQAGQDPCSRAVTSLARTQVLARGPAG